MRTPLYDAHVALGARMVDFAGWDMPVQYAGIVAEHRHTRAAASLFDICHMSEFRVVGPDAADALHRALACRVDGLGVGRCRYGFLLAEDGGVFDDLICYRTGEEEFLLVANAARRDSDAAVLAERLGAGLRDESDATAKLDLQGPASLTALRSVCDGAPEALPYYGAARMNVVGLDALVSRSGYTGELGYELYVAADDAVALWDALLALDGVEPGGLGARDTLRLEMAYPLYGHELDETTTPADAGYSWALPKHQDYVGAGRRPSGAPRKLAAIQFDGRRAARHGDALLHDGAPVGVMTSGSFAPSLGCAVALGYVPPELADEGTSLAAEIRGRAVPGRIVAAPFYHNGTARGLTR
jgi:glycine cleavage system T protein (aminomethyltransferase)